MARILAKCRGDENHDNIAPFFCLHYNPVAIVLA
jgi:hypothetical protein